MYFEFTQGDKHVTPDKQTDRQQAPFVSHVHTTLQPTLSIGQSVGRSVGRLVGHTLLFLRFHFFDLTTPAQMTY